MASVNSFHGIFTPLVTPITEDEQIDLASLRRLVDYQIDNGIHGIWAMGTTGEFASFDESERAAAIDAVISQSAGRVPVIANISDAATRLVIRHAKRAEAAGADAVAATPPYYYPHSQAELLEHYRTISKSTSLPLFIYNIPQTVRVTVALDTAIQLMDEGTVAGIKDSQNNFEWFRQLMLHARKHHPEFRGFAGTRHVIDAAVLIGACGAIPSIANAYPELCVAAYDAAAHGDFDAAREPQSRIIEIERLVKWGAASNNGAVIGGLKELLQAKGIITYAGVTRPLLTK